jgi:hypothetical protein
MVENILIDNIGNNISVSDFQPGFRENLNLSKVVILCHLNVKPDPSWANI